MKKFLIGIYLVLLAGVAFSGSDVQSIILDSEGVPKANLRSGDQQNLIKVSTTGNCGNGNTCSDNGSSIVTATPNGTCSVAGMNNQIVTRVGNTVTLSTRLDPTCTAGTAGVDFSNLPFSPSNFAAGDAQGFCISTDSVTPANDTFWRCTNNVALISCGGQVIAPGPIFHCVMHYRIN